MKVPAFVFRLETDRCRASRKASAARFSNRPRWTHLVKYLDTTTPCRLLVLKGLEQSTLRKESCGLSLVARKVGDPPSWGKIKLSRPELASPAAVPVPPYWRPIPVMVLMKVEVLSPVGPGWASATAGKVAHWSEG